MGLSVDQVMALPPCSFFTRERVESYFAGRETCELADFLAMDIFNRDKLVVILREEILPEATLQSISDAIYALLSQDAKDSLEMPDLSHLPEQLRAQAESRYSALINKHKYARYAAVYVNDFDRATIYGEEKIEVLWQRGDDLMTLVMGML